MIGFSALFTLYIGYSFGEMSNIKGILYICGWKYTKTGIMVKVIHVHLIFERKDYYFGSVKGGYKVLDETQLGVKESYLYKALAADGDVKVTGRAIIRRSHLL